MTVEELQVLITANTNSLRKEINNVKQDIQGLQKSATKSSSNIFKAVLKGNIATKLIGMAFKTLTSNMDDAISRFDALNNFPRVMSNLGVSNEDAQASMQRLSDALIGLPTTLDDATQSVQRFTSANGNVKASTEMFLALNNAILSGGASAQVQSTALEQLSQAYAKGKPDMMEWRSAMTAMPAQLKQVAIAMGYANASQLGEDLRSGAVSMNEFMVKITELNKRGVNGFLSFEEQARNSTGGVRTSMINVKTAITRGLAEVMNAIGQSNIAGFFQTIARAINSVIPYVTGFVKACVWAVGSISSLFGTSTKSKVENINKSLGNLGSTAGGSMNSGLSKATGSAKKLKKELKGLAGFDEMNVLKDNSDTGSGSGADSSGGGGDMTKGLGDIDLSAFDTQASGIVSKADEIANKFKKIFSDFAKGINFDNLVKSFKNLQDSIAPLIDKLKNGLYWCYENILKPLAQWTIGELLPASLNVVAGALDVLNQAIEDVTPIFEFLWTNILKPVAKWTGGVITKTLNAIGDALEWISKNQIAMSILEGIAIAIGLVAGAIAVYNVAMTLCNVVTGVFAGIMAVLTSPITLVVGAVALLTTGIILLIKNWNTVSKVAGDVWNFIKGVWNGVATWFNNTVIQPIANFFGGMWNNLRNGANNAWNGIKSVFSGVANFFRTTFNNAWNGVKAIFNAGGKIFEGIKEGITNAFKSIVNAMITGINKVVAIPFNKVNNLLNTIRNVKIPVINKKPFKGLWAQNPLPVPQIPKLARGGIIDRPTYAMIGENGKEAVMPLERNTGWIDKLALKINESNNSDTPIKVVVNIGDDTVFEKVISAIRNKDFETNGEVFNI